MLNNKAVPVEFCGQNMQKLRENCSQKWQEVNLSII